MAKLLKFTLINTLKLAIPEVQLFNRLKKNKKTSLLFKNWPMNGKMTKMYLIRMFPQEMLTGQNHLRKL